MERSDGEVGISKSMYAWKEVTVCHLSFINVKASKISVAYLDIQEKTTQDPIGSATWVPTISYAQVVPLITAEYMGWIQLLQSTPVNRQVRLDQGRMPTYGKRRMTCEKKYAI